jgi:hypothetical protein
MKRDADTRWGRIAISSSLRLVQGCVGVQSVVLALEADGSSNIARIWDKR